MISREVMETFRYNLSVNTLSVDNRDRAKWTELGFKSKKLGDRLWRNLQLTIPEDVLTLENLEDLKKLVRLAENACGDGILITSGYNCDNPDDHDLFDIGIHNGYCD